MKIRGLSKDLKIEQYLKSVYGLDSFDVEGIPLFRKDDEHFLGGFKGFYTVIIDEDKETIEEVIKKFFEKYPEATCNFSVSGIDARASLVHYLLRLNRDTPIEKRFEIYNKKTRNQVRKSYLNELRLEVGAPPREFYDLYLANMKRLKSIAKDESYFDRLEKFLGESVVCFSLFDGGKLIGCNYAVVSEDYIMLLLNLSNNNYWNLNINDRLYDELIAWAIQHNIEFVDFGPSIRKDESHNHFKGGFGASRRTIITRMQMSFLKRLYFFILEKKRNIRLRFIKFKK